MSEKRKHVRVPSKGKAAYVLLEEAKDLKDLKDISRLYDVKSATTVNVSGGGVFLQTSEELPSGTLLAFQFQPSGEEKAFFAVGEVVWTEKNETGFGSGVQFVRILENDHYGLFDYVVQKVFETLESHVGSAEVLTEKQ